MQLKDSSLGKLFEDELELMLKRTDINKNKIITPENVFQEAVMVNRDIIYNMIKRVTLDGSKIINIENLIKLYNLSQNGYSCIMMFEHVSNFDVPNFYYLMRRAGYEHIFNTLVYIAGLKLNEEDERVKAITEAFTRLVIQPKLEFYGISEEDKEARTKAFAINRAAQEVMKEIKNRGRIFVLFPTGTRTKPWDESTKRGIREAYNYLKAFDYFLCGAAIGNNMPPMKGPMINEIVKPDKIIFNIGKVYKTSEFIEKMKAKFKDEKNAKDFKQYVIDNIMQEIYKLHIEVEGE